MTNPQAIKIYQGQDFYVPTFELKLKERVLPKDVVRDVMQVTYKDSLSDIDSFDLTINNWDADTRDFKYVDEETFNPGKEIELWMGYFGKDKLRLMMKGEITSLRPSFPSGGQPTLNVSGLNILHRFRQEQISFAYIKRTDSEIAREIGTRLKVTFETGKTPEQRYDYLLQENQYDIVFLMERARRIGYDIFVQEKSKNGQSQKPTIYFGPSVDLRRVTYELKYGISLIEFQPALTTANQVGEVIVRGWNAKTKKFIEGKATRDDIKTKGIGKNKGQGVIDQSFNQRKEVIADRPIATEEEAKQLARETLERIAKDMITATGSVVGVPDLRAGSIIKVLGLGDRFSGTYFVTGTTHSINDSGYITQFECRREEV